MKELIWFEDPLRFITMENYNKFFPSNNMTFAEQLNSLLRLSIYFTLVVFLFKHDPNIFFVVIFMAIFTFFLYKVDNENKKSEHMFLKENNMKKEKNGKVCIKPTKDNPFMNVLVSDYAERPDRPPACNSLNPVVKNDIQEAFDYGLYRDTGDIFSKIASDRQWVTNSSTTIPNNRDKFAKWLYQVGPTCKEGLGEACYKALH
jgi:hypothetical protein